MTERIPLVGPDDDGLDASTRELLRGMRDAELDFNVIRGLANHPALLEGFMAFSSVAYWGSSVDPALRELAYLSSSVENECHY